MPVLRWINFAYDPRQKAKHTRLFNAGLQSDRDSCLIPALAHNGEQPAFSIFDNTGKGP